LLGTKQEPGQQPDGDPLVVPGGSDEDKEEHAFFLEKRACDRRAF
jgi:hypothetical protein